MQRLTLRARKEYAALAQWWLHEIREALADLQQVLAPGRPHRTTLSLSATAGTVTQQWRNGTVRSAQFQRTATGDLPENLSTFWPTTPTDGATVDVVLPQSAVLIRRVWLPAGAERNLAPVIQLQLERELPMPREQVIADWRIVARNRDRTKIEVAVAILWRSEHDRLINALHGWQLRIASIGVSMGDATAFNFSPRRASHAAGEFSRLDRALAISVGALLLTYICTLGVHWIYERKVLEEAITQANGPAQRVERMQSQLAALRLPMTTLMKIMDSSSSAEVLTDLTAAIPRESWVQQLEVHSIDANAYTLELVAITPAATVLVDQLVRTPRFQEVELHSAGPSAQSTGRDRAEIQTTWRKQPKP